MLSAESGQAKYPPICSNGDAVPMGILGIQIRWLCIESTGSVDDDGAHRQGLAKIFWPAARTETSVGCFAFEDRPSPLLHPVVWVAPRHGLDGPGSSLRPCLTRPRGEHAQGHVACPRDTGIESD